MIDIAGKSALMLAAPTSGSGKTLLQLALLRILRDRGVAISAAKAGPDYIDPRFHEVACGSTSVNLDPWAMNKDRLQVLAANQTGSHLLIEAMMGLFDGAADGSASAAELAKTLDVPVVLIVDAAKQSHSIGALMRGFRDHDPKVNVAGVILNKVGSPRHEAMLRSALDAVGIPVLGAVVRDASLELPVRHLGLVQAGEIGEIEEFVANAADTIAGSLDMEQLLQLFADMKTGAGDRQCLPPLGSRIAVASDKAFSFVYPHMLEDWRYAGAHLSFFSPLANEAPDPSCDAVFLPGGYPELHGEKLATAKEFHEGLRLLRNNGATIYGECGGYMVMGDSIIDAEGSAHQMSGLLRLETSFQQRKLHLGYRQIETVDFPLGRKLRGHEFHYTSAVREEGNALFFVRDALGQDMGSAGLRQGNVMGSYMHVIDQVHT